MLLSKIPQNCTICLFGGLRFDISMNWHQKDIEDIFEELHSSRTGLSADEARKRLEEHGLNVIREEKKKGPFLMLLDQFRDFMILVLIAAAVISGVVGEFSDSLAIIVIVILNAVLGFVQEYRAEKAMTALKKMAALTATVIRDAKTAEIQASGLVPGDIVLLETGKIVPADMRLTEAAHLKVVEASLTGESLPSEKQIRPLRDEALPLGDRINMAYKGTTVSYGRGRGIVIATGMDTELGKVASMLQVEEEVKTPLQKRLAAFGRNLSFAILVICAVIFGAGLLRGESPVLMLLTAISLAVAAIPEALPAVVTISLALGAKKMVRQNALMRKLPAVETLGSVTYICSDKTGTLTQNRMTVEECYVDGREVESEKLKVKSERGDELPVADSQVSSLLVALALCNDAGPDKDGEITGDPTETALYVFAKEAGFAKDELVKSFPRIGELPFDSERKCMTTIHKWASGQGFTDSSEKNNHSPEPLSPRPPEFPLGEDSPDAIADPSPSFNTGNPPLPPFGRGGEGGFVSFTKGAIEVLLERSVNVLTSAGTGKIDVDEIRRVNDRMATDGLRIIGIAMRQWETLPDNTIPDTVEAGLTFLGLVGMMDPPREEVGEAISSCKKAGIKPVMITGDHPVTARAIAGRIGVLEDDSGPVLTGKELAELSMEKFEAAVEHIRVYARVAPEQKLKIVKALQDKGQFVAMTGDGVNDAPALKRADIGIAMRITGTDVAKEASHMILLDDNFATIVKAVKEGRKIYDNLRKIIKYLLSSNSGEIWTLFLAPFFGLPIPLVPIQILWINLTTDALPAIALSAEPEESDVMERPPRHPKESVFVNGLGFYCIWVGLVMAGVTLATQAWSIHVSGSHWQTMVFTVLCLSQFGNALAVRSERESFFRIGPLSNKYLLGAVILSFFLQMATIYVPSLNPIFKTQPLSLNELLATIGLSSIVFFAAEGQKLWKKRARFSNR
jgi:Ca2+-transporting ATPase